MSSSGKLRPSLLIFVKNPQLGKVKTRLASTLGDVKALQIYEALLAHTREVALVLKGVSRHVYYSSFVPQQDNWPSPPFYKHLQQGATLGERMKQAFEQAFEQAGPAVIIGSDCPLISPPILQDAFEALQQHRYVIGPAMDGGYYLLGMANLSTSLFDGIDWSTNKVYEQTMDKIKRAGSEVVTLPTLPDVDYEADWKQYGWPI